MCFRYITCIIRVSDFCHVHLNALSSPCVSLIDVSPLGFSTVSGFEKKLVQVAGSKRGWKDDLMFKIYPKNQGIRSITQVLPYPSPSYPSNIIQPGWSSFISKALHHRWANNTRATRRRDQSGAHGTALAMDLEKNDRRSLVRKKKKTFHGKLTKNWWASN